MLELKEITKKFGKKEILKGISYTFGKGVYGLIKKTCMSDIFL